MAGAWIPRMPWTAMDILLSNQNAYLYAWWVPSMQYIWLYILYLFQQCQNPTASCSLHLISRSRIGWHGHKLCSRNSFLMNPPIRLQESWGSTRRETFNLSTCLSLCQKPSLIPLTLLPSLWMYLTCTASHLLYLPMHLTSDLFPALRPLAKYSPIQVSCQYGMGESNDTGWDGCLPIHCTNFLATLLSKDAFTIPISKRRWSPSPLSISNGLNSWKSTSPSKRTISMLLLPSSIVCPRSLRWLTTWRL